MDINKLLNDISYSDIDEYVKLLIEDYSKNAINENDGNEIIGFNIDINHNDNLAYFAKDGYHVQMRSFWKGFIPSNVRIIYGYSTNEGKIYNDGKFYQADDQTYLYDFFKYLKNCFINTNDELMEKVAEFIFYYLGRFVPETIERNDRFKLIINSNEKFFKPINEHSIKNFYFDGSAKCTEYALLAQNILTLLGADMYYVMNMDHAYNIYVSEDDYYTLLDYTYGTYLYNIDLTKNKYIPYLASLYDVSAFNIDDYLMGKEEIITEDFFDIKYGDKILEYKTGRSRNYSILKEYKL